MTIIESNAVEITPDARDRYAECITAVHAAHVWAQGLDINLDVVTGEAAQEMVLERANHVHEMASSLSGNLTRLMFTPAADGKLVIMSDTAPLSFFWSYESGYMGGLIFHANHSGDERLPVGTWSVHT